MLEFLIKRRGYVWTSILIVIGFLTGVVIVFYQQVLETWPLFLWAMAYIVAGGAVGMIFGIPKEMKQVPEALATPMNSNSDEVKEYKAQAIRIRNRNLEENTNLNQISDWLTKVIVGAGLVQLKEIPGFVVRVAEKMSRGLACNSLRMDAAISTSAAMIIYFTIYGFITGYLITKVMITDLLEGSDKYP